MRAEGFSCVLDDLYRGLGISKLHFLIKKKVFSCNIFLTFLLFQNLRYELDPDSLEILDPTLDELQIRHRSGAMLPKLS